MQYLGMVKTLAQAISESNRIANEENKLVVFDKCKFKDKAGLLKVGYRGWLERDSDKAEVLSYKEWKEKRKSD